MRRWLLAAVLATACLEAPPSSPPGPPGADAARVDCVCPGDPCPFSVRRGVHIDGTALAEDLTGAPVLVRVETSDTMAADGSDLRFATTDGSLLPHEIELFPAPGGIAAVWVGVPSIAAGADTELCLFYGADAPGAAADPISVWDPGFAGVWHLGEATSGAVGELSDSSGHDCDGRGMAADAGRLPKRIAAVIGQGQELVDEAFLTFGTGAHLDIAGSTITLEAWLLVPRLTGTYMPVVGKEGYYSGYRLMVGPAGELLFQLTDGERRLESAAGTVDAGSWHHVAATYDGARMRLYVDGAMVDQKIASGEIAVNTVPMRAGESDDEFHLEGSLDELRISSVARSAAWIALQHLAGAGELVSVGEPEPL